MNRRPFRNLILFIAAVMGPCDMFGQGTTITDPVLGMSFVVPGGWKSQGSDGGYLLVSEQTPGFIIVLPHEIRSLDEMRREAAEGLNEGEELQLSLVGEIQDFGVSGISAEFEGLINGASARAHVVGLLSPHGGGATIIAGTERQAYSTTFVQLAEQLARSVKFTKPETGGISSAWQSKLSGKKLTYLSGYSDAGSGGYTSQRVISLCVDRRFVLRGKSLVSVDSPSATGSSAGTENGEGRWDIVVVAGQPLLRLDFSDGSIQQYGLSMEEGKLRLDGRRYFLTDDPECR